MQSAPSPSNTYALAPSELTELTKRAELGDVSAMNRLSLFYLISQDQQKKGIFWLEQAAENGDLKARESVLGYYADSQSPADKRHGEELKQKWKM